MYCSPHASRGDPEKEGHRRGSSVVEQMPEEHRVVSSILTRGTSKSAIVRVSYSGYYTTLPWWRRGFDSLYPLTNIKQPH